MDTVNSKKKGFTLVEILIVLTIISLVVLLGFSSYGFAQKKIRLDIAANSVQSLISEARDKTKAGYYESSSDAVEAKSLCYGFKAYPGGGVELLTTPYDPIKTTEKCSLNLNNIIVVKKPETSNDIILKKVEMFGAEQADPVIVFFQPPNAEIEFTSMNLTSDPVMKLNVGYSNSDNIQDQRQVVFNVLTGNVKLQLLNENNED